MATQSRRATALPRLEILEARALLSGTTTGASATVTVPTGPAASVFVRFAVGVPDGQARAGLDAVGGRLVSAFPGGTDLVTMPPWVNHAEAVRVLRADPAVVYVETSRPIRAAAVPANPVTPNDPKFLSQWGLGTIDAPYAWSITTGTPSTIVAVLDTGIDLSNPEFAGRIWTNPTANRDGYRGDLHGWNFVSKTGNVADDDGHGTHVSGVLAAAGNNGYGIAGVAWGVQIMPLKVLDSGGNGSTDSAVSAVYFAVAHGARVVNASWGGDSYSRAMLDALNYANSKGVVFVTAAGNESSNNDAARSDPQNAATYPASYRTPNELVVAALDPSGRLADFSNYGPATVDLAAPGVGIVSVVPGNLVAGGFATFDGTSMSTPFVAGTVALLAGANPGLSAGQLVARVRATAKPLAALNGLLIAAGVVDPLNALLNLQPLHPGAGPGPVATGNPPGSPPAAPLVPGATTLSGVESGLLNHGAVYSLFGGTASGYVDGAYQALIGRAPNPDELAYNTLALQSGGSRVDLVAKLQNSDEGRLTRVARWYSDELGASAPVSALESDPGVKIYANLLANGYSVATVQGLMFDNIVSGIGPDVATPGWVATYLYRCLLSRAPDSGGLALFTARLQSGASVAQVARQVLASAEGHLTTIAYLYRDDLGSSSPLRALQADSGVAYWASLLGED